jgi:hypothetical protein
VLAKRKSIIVFTAKFNPRRGRELAERALAPAQEVDDPCAETTENEQRD